MGVAFLRPFHLQQMRWKSVSVFAPRSSSFLRDRMTLDQGSNARKSRIRVFFGLLRV